MAISPATLKRLSALDAPPEVIREVLSILADAMAGEEERLAKQRDRKTRQRQRQLANGPVTVTGQDHHVTGQSQGQSQGQSPPIEDHNPPVSSLRSDISDANASSSETSSDTLAEETPKRRKRVSYPPDFEAFWTAFPTDALMSKKAAGLVWSRMTEDVRQLAMSPLPAFRAYCTSKPDYRPVHAVRYLTQERFVGFSEVVSKAAGKVFVAKGTPQWTAWQRVQHSSCVTSAEHRQDGWWFESEWPNGSHVDERKTA